MKLTLHKADTRGSADHGWLRSFHTFSFANYYNPERMNFGALRVINDDIIAPSMGFGTHPHNNMEIISVPISGALRHKDTIGNDFVIKEGEIQSMSAGTGIAHSEYNDSAEKDANFLQIWVMPKKMNIAPSYSQRRFPEDERLNRFQLVVSPDARGGSVKINQDAYFTLVKLNRNESLVYSKYREENGVYFFIISGETLVNDNLLGRRDGLGVENANDLKVTGGTESEVLVMEVPMQKLV